jgi:hypothetical protein
MLWGGCIRIFSAVLLEYLLRHIFRYMLDALIATSARLASCCLLPMAVLFAMVVITALQFAPSFQALLWIAGV